MSVSGWGSDGKEVELSDLGGSPLAQTSHEAMGRAGAGGKTWSWSSPRNHWGLGGCLHGKYSHLLSEVSPCLFRRQGTEAE